MPKEFAKLGFFHFGAECKSDPIGSLRQSLLEASKVKQLVDSLVVLPEAFNIRNDYWMPNRRVDFTIARSLREISAEFKGGFVAGLIEQGRRHSAAHLIDGEVFECLARKLQDDGSGNYQVHENCGTWRVYRGICIAALICMDAAGFNENCKSAHHSALLERLTSCGSQFSVLCVPAHFMEYDNRGVALSWPSSLSVVIANSYPHQPSVLRMRSDPPICHSGFQNIVCVSDIPKC